MPASTHATMEECAHMCHECQDVCLATIVHCLDLGGEHAGREHQTLLADCAEICNTAHSFMHRHSPRHGLVCAACAEICRACADDCEKIGRGDKQMTHCAEVCRQCAEMCRQMAAA